MAKKYVWSYQVTDRCDSRIISGHIVLPTKCGVTAATEVSKHYDETCYVTFLNLLGVVDD